MPTHNEIMMLSVFYGQAMNELKASRNYAEAVRLFNVALGLDPNNGEIYHNRGIAYTNLERWREAVSDFSHAISLSPHPSSFEQRGMAYYQIGDKDSAFKDWQQALQINSRSVFAVTNLACLAIEKSQFQQAIKLCSQAILIEPTYAKVYQLRAHAYLETGDRPHHLADLQTAHELVASGRDTSDNDSGER